MKLGFIGAGRVGSASAYAVINHLAIDELVLIDIVEELAIGEALDLLHAAYALGKPVKIMGGSDYSMLDGSDIIVISAGVPRKPGMTRLDLLQKNAEIIRNTSRRLRRYVDGSLILVVTNPVDIMTYLVWREVGLPRERVFGMGSLLDTVRLWSISGRPSSGLVIGEHGETMFIAEGEKRFEDEVRRAGMEVIKRKGATIYGPATCIYRMLRAIVEDAKELIPLSAVLQGEYGLRDLAIGVPAILGRSGIERIVELKGAEDELRRSAEIIREKLKELGY